MRRIHLLLVIGSGLVFSSVLLPAIWPAADWLRIFFAPICHQIPERSFRLNNGPLAVCARCTGFYAGFLIGLLIDAFRPIGMRPRALRLMLVVTLCDALNAFLGLFPDSALFRFCSALFLSILLTPFIIRGVEEVVLTVRPASLRLPLSSFTRKDT